MQIITVLKIEGINQAQNILMFQFSLDGNLTPDVVQLAGALHDSAL